MKSNVKAGSRSLKGDIESFTVDVERFLAGQITPAMFKAKRVPMGIYEQRQSGSFMQRVRAPGGKMSSAQAAAVAAVAATHSGEPLHFTTRQDVQLHGLAVERVASSMKLLGEAGLSSRGGGGNTVRNILACTYAGTCPSELFDVQPYVDAVTNYMVSIEGAYNLPRKYKLSFSGCGCDCACGKINDLGFISEVREGKAGFKVVAGGGLGSGPRVGAELEEWIPANECLASAEAMRRVFDRHGDRKNRNKARLRFVFERLGHEAVRNEYLEEKSALVKEGMLADVPDAITSDPAAAARPQLERLGDAWTVKESKTGLLSLRLFFSKGLVDADVLSRIAELTKEFSTTDTMRLTVDQGLLIESVAESRLGELAAAAAECSPAILDRGWHNTMVSCAGAATCRLGLCLSRDLVQGCESAFSEQGISNEGLGEELVRINGCPNACGKHLVGGIGLSGAARRTDGKLYPAYSVFFGGAAGADPRLGELAGTVPAKAVPSMLADVFAEFRANALEGEEFAGYLKRAGSAALTEIVEKHAVLPENADQLGYTSDWGSDEAFSLAGRGAGECGAGVFEVVSEDIETAEAKMREADSGDLSVLAAAFLATVRALLIVRGVDVVEPDAIVREFEKHFIDSGLVDEKFRNLLSRGRAHLSGVDSALEGQGEEAALLLARVKELYDSLDASLQFNVEEAKSGDSGDSAEAGDDLETLDLKGVACPINFVKAKLKLETIEVGRSLAITLDDGEPVKNVPASFREQGQEVVSMNDNGDGHWTIVVKRVS